MVLFRVINDDEYKELFKGIPREETSNKYNVSSKNYNSFDYNRDINYMHFFKFAEHARKYMHLFGDRLIMCDIPNDLIEQFGYGAYKYSNDKKIVVPVPEIIINRDNFDLNYILKDRPKKRNCIQYIDGINKFELYDELLKKMYFMYIEAKRYPVFNNYDFILFVIEYFGYNDIDDVLLDYLNNGIKKETMIKLRKR